MLVGQLLSNSMEDRMYAFLSIFFNSATSYVKEGVAAPPPKVGDISSSHVSESHQIPARS